jgi:hypothetical protein
LGRRPRFYARSAWRRLSPAHIFFFLLLLAVMAAVVSQACLAAE